jgi:AcrR family transcriptional regulator
MARTAAERQDIIPVLAEIFRIYGYEGASLTRITEGTGLGKGSLYHFFPGGKEEMATAVLAHIDGWFQQHVYAPLRQPADPAECVANMFDEVSRYFASGRKVCLVGMFALGNERDRFAQAVSAYFRDWAASLASTLQRGDVPPGAAQTLAEQIVGGIQGALVMARALQEPQVFARITDSLRRHALAALGRSGLDG